MQWSGKKTLLLSSILCAILLFAVSSQLDENGWIAENAWLRSELPEGKSGALLLAHAGKGLMAAAALLVSGMLLLFFMGKSMSMGRFAVWTILLWTGSIFLASLLTTSLMHP